MVDGIILVDIHIPHNDSDGEVFVMVSWKWDEAFHSQLHMCINYQYKIVFRIDSILAVDDSLDSLEESIWKFCCHSDIVLRMSIEQRQSKVLFRFHWEFSFIFLLSTVSAPGWLSICALQCRYWKAIVFIDWETHVKLLCGKHCETHHITWSISYVLCKGAGRKRIKWWEFLYFVIYIL